MINFQNIRAVAEQATKPSPLIKAIGEERTRRRHEALARDIKQQRLDRIKEKGLRDQENVRKAHARATAQAAKANERTAAQAAKANERTAAQAARTKAQSAKADARTNARQGGLWDRYKQTGKGTFNQDPLFPQTGPQRTDRPSVERLGDLAPAGAEETAQKFRHVPGQVDMFSHRDVGPLAPTARVSDNPVWPPAGHQFSLFPEPKRTPAPSPQWTQGNLFDSQPDEPAKPQGTQGELFNSQLKPYRQARIAPHRQVDPNTPMTRPAPLAPQPPAMGHLVEQARKLSAQTWVPEGYTPPNKP